MDDLAPWAQSEEWQALLRHFDYHEGFGFAVLFVPDKAGAEGCRTALAAHLRASARTLLDVPLEKPPDLREIAGRLLALEPGSLMTVKAGAVWIEMVVGERDPAFADWNAALTEGLARLNLIRNALAAKLPCTLVFCVPGWAQGAIRDVAPDWWSVRSIVVRIPREETKGRGEPARLYAPRDVDAPDEELALAEAAKLRGKAGQEATLARVLHRAGRGLSAARRGEEAEKVLLEAAAVADRGGAPPALRAEICFSLGEVLETLGERSRAIREFEQAARLYGEAGDFSMRAASLSRAPFDVFLSHSAKDKDVVRRIAERLRGDGVRVWFDEWEIQPGDPIPAKIEEGLEGSRLLVLCMSAHAFGSEWAQLETGTFRFRDPMNRGRRFLPLRLDDTPAKGSLAQFAHLDIRREGAYEKLLAACVGDRVTGSGYLERLIREVEAKARLYSPLSGVGVARRAGGAERLLAAWSDDPDIVLLRHRSRQGEAVETREYEDILTAFGSVRRAALLGAPGGGKSTTLRRLALELAERARRDGSAPWPVLVELGRWVGDETLADFLAAERPDCGVGGERRVLLLDGLNEVPTGKRGEKAREVRAMAARAAALIVSCRAEDYTGELELGLDTLTLEPLTPPRVRSALRQWAANGGAGEELGERIFWELAGDAGLAGVLEKWRGAGA
ncbi:MAG: TIR domain-containing protein, partial [Acidobacteriaceae bacterium]|nr:TIR domain-containing protein [Acidobacteriaceae bacterium]